MQISLILFIKAIMLWIWLRKVLLLTVNATAQPRCLEFPGTCPRLALRLTQKWLLQRNTRLRAAGLPWGGGSPWKPCTGAACSSPPALLWLLITGSCSVLGYLVFAHIEPSFIFDAFFHPSPVSFSKVCLKGRQKVTTVAKPALGILNCGQARN